MMKCDWKKCKLINETISIGDGIHGTPKYDTNSDVFFINGNNLLNGHIHIKEDTKRVSAVQATIHQDILSDRTLLISINGTLGNVAYYCGEPVVLGKSACYVNVNSQNDKKFFYYLFTSPMFQQYLHFEATGTTIKNVSLKSMRNFEFLLPPLEEQKRIAQILGALDDKIELLQKQNKTLEDMAKAIFKSWFVDFDVVHAKQKGLPKADIMREYHLTDELYDLFPSGFEPSALGPIPHGWQVKTLGDISTCYDSKRIPLSNRERAERQGNYPYYGATSIMDHVDDFLFDGIYLLLGEDGSVVKPEGTPFLQYVFGKIWVNNHAHVLQGKAPVGTEFLYLFLSDVQIQPYVTGAVQAKLNQKNMNSIPVCMATEDFVRQFQGIIEIYFVKIRSNLKQIQTLTELRDALLPRLISGKIRV